MIRRRTRFSIWIFMLIAGACSRAEKVHPNVVLVVIDTLRADHCSAYGYQRDTTPHLESLAREGTLFENNWAQAPWTCPSMVSLFTGRYVIANYRTLPPGVPTLPERFQEAGCSTGALVANPILTDEIGFDRGFDHFEVGRKTAQGTQMDARIIVQKSAELFTEKLEEPFFAWIHLFDPHAPYIARGPFKRLLEKESHLFTLDEYRSRQPPEAERAIAPDDVEGFEKILRNYDCEVAYADEALGEIMKQLNSLGLEERTLIAVTSDHGEGLYSHAGYFDPHRKKKHFSGLYLEHGEHVYEEALHVPLVIRGPGIQAHRRVSGLVENLDLYATLLAVAGLPPDPYTTGRDLRDLADEGKPAVFAFGIKDCAVRMRSGLKLIHPVLPHKDDDRFFKFHFITTQHPDRNPQGYDLSKDPGERINLFQEDVEEFNLLKERLIQWQEQHKDALPDSVKPSPGWRRKLKALGYVQ